MAHMNWDRVRVEARGRPNGWDTLGDPSKISKPKKEDSAARRATTKGRHEVQEVRHQNYPQNP